jgi:membrane-associated phospholipid phosphatase
MNRFLSSLDTLDLSNVAFFVLLTIAMLIWSAAIPLWWVFLIVNIVVIVSVPVLAWFAHGKKPIWNLLHGFYSMVCIPIAFKEMYFLVPAIHPVDYDASLIMIDYAIFGVHPTQWMYQFSHPVVTEILQLAYASFYLLPLVLVIDLYKRKRYQAFRITFFIVILGFYLSYFGYVAVPATGPRFTLHEFESIEEELPGLLLTGSLRIYTNSGESIPEGTVNPQKHVQRDVFPSGHTLVTLLVMWLAWRYRARSRWYLWISGTLLIIATVYLRYHYVIDLVGGFIFAVLTVRLGWFMISWWYGKKPRPALKSVSSSEA